MKFDGRLKIPLAEVERVEREGTDPIALPRQPAPRPSAARSARAEADAIRKLKL